MTERIKPIDQRISWLGDRALRLELPADDELGNARRMRRICSALDRMIAGGQLPGLDEVIPALGSITLLFDPLQADPPSWRDRLLAAMDSRAEPDQANPAREIPVCFDDDFGPDLAELAAIRSETRESFIARFLAARVEVLMLGFLPGFAYLGSLPQACQAPRLATPRAKVAAGSVAIAGSQCAVYPWESPGGWNLIGRTPLTLFDKADPSAPVWLRPGDPIVWRPIDRAGFESWSE